MPIRSAFSDALDNFCLQPFVQNAYASSLRTRSVSDASRQDAGYRSKQLRPGSDCNLW